MKYKFIVRSYLPVMAETFIDARDDKTALEKNMVITLEPSMEYKTGKMIVHEENILITEKGRELLSTRTPKSLPIIN